MNFQMDTEEIRSKLLAGARRIITSSSPGEYATAARLAPSRLHRHPYRELAMVLQGESQFLLNGKIYPAQPGTVFLLNQWELHEQGYRESDHGLLHLWIYFSDREATSASMFHVSVRGQFVPVGRHLVFDHKLLYLINYRWDMLERPACALAKDPERLMRSAVNTLLEEIALRQFDLNASTPENTQDITVFLRNYIKNNNGCNCSLEQLEKLSGYSRFHLATLFKRRHGKTIGEYISEVRMEFFEEAGRRGMKQKEIATELGFSSPASFWYWLHRGHRKA